MHMGERIKEERERLGFNQSDFAALATATRKTLFNWESGAAAPNATVLATWAAHGLDVLYVVTGQRAGTAAPAPALSRRAQALVENYEATGEDGKKIIEAAAFAAAKPGAAARKPKAA